MCGLSLIVNPGKEDLAALLEMHARQAHRGPDGEGFLTVDRRGAGRNRAPAMEAWQEPPLLAAAFRRLKVQDPSPAADQPMVLADGRHWLLMNGEVYNFRELRRELIERGHTFRSSGDAEVVLASYVEWGTRCVERFNGMWAFVIVDLERRVLFGARDRLGIKPLYYAEVRGGLWLASEARALALASGLGPNPRRLRSFLEGFPPGVQDSEATPDATRESFFEGVHAVPAASVFELEFSEPRAGAPTFRRFWSLDACRWESQPAPGLTAAAQDLRECLTESVKLRSTADVPVGALLSGGLDSSLVATLLARSGPDPARTYSLVYDDPHMDESLFIGAVTGAAPERFDARREKVSAQSFWDVTERVIEAQGEPLLGWDLVAQYEAYRLARSGGSVVVLDGQGPDEVLGGYGSHELAALRDAVRQGPLLRSIAEIRGFAKRRGSSTLSVARSVLRPFHSGLPGLARRSRATRYPWLAPLPRSTASAAPHPLSGSHLDQLLRDKTERTNLPTVLAHQDKSAMAHGVESRVPYLDHRLIELCFRLPPTHKVWRGVRKRVLREAARGVLPRIVVERRDKRAFVSSVEWFPLGRWETEVRAALHASSLAEEPWIRGAAIEPFVDGYFRGEHADVLGVWRLFTAARWLDIHASARSGERRTSAPKPGSNQTAHA